MPPTMIEVIVVLIALIAVLVACIGLETQRRLAKKATSRSVSKPIGARHPKITPPNIVLVTESVRRIKKAVSLRGKRILKAGCSHL